MSPPGKPAESTLAEAISNHQQGRTGAVDALLIACSARLEKLARRLLQGHPEIRRGCHDTGDIVQEAAQRLWRALEQVKPQSERHVMALASLAVRREVIDLSRKYRGPRSPSQGQATNYVLRNGESIWLAEEAVDDVTGAETLDDWTRFHDAIDRLPPDLQEVFTMRFYLGAKVDHVAAMLECDSRTVKRRWARAIELISKELGGMGQ